MVIVAPDTTLTLVISLISDVRHRYVSVAGVHRRAVFERHINGSCDSGYPSVAFPKGIKPTEEKFHRLRYRPGV